MNNKYKSVDFSKITVEDFEKITREKLNKMKKALKEIRCLINKDFYLLVDLKTDSACFLGNSSEQATKLYKTIKEINLVIEKVLTK